MTTSGLRTLWAIVALFLAVENVAAQERSGSPPPEPDRGAGKQTRYYLCVFAYQTEPPRVQFSHTFATFVKSDGDSFEAHTISWLPRSLDIRVLRRFGEPGANFGLKETLEVAAGVGARIYEWGPFEIKPELYKRALRQIDTLNSGRILYKAVDANWRGNGASNCIHAVADVDTDRGFLKVGREYGAAASAMVAEHLSPWFIQPDHQVPWINEKLGLPKPPLVPRELDASEGLAPNPAANTRRLAAVPPAPR